MAMVACTLWKFGMIPDVHKDVGMTCFEFKSMVDLNMENILIGNRL